KCLNGYVSRHPLDDLAALGHDADRALARASELQILLRASNAIDHYARRLSVGVDRTVWCVHFHEYGLTWKSLGRRHYDFADDGAGHGCVGHVASLVQCDKKRA